MSLYKHKLWVIKRNASLNAENIRIWGFTLFNESKSKVVVYNSEEPAISDL